MATQLFQPPHGSPAWFHACVSDVASSGAIRSEVVSLGPDLASELLRNNPGNRFVRPQKIAQLVSDIRQGRWTFNGEPVLISKEGLLNDGQHRANAVVETNISVDVLMVFGLDRSSRTTIDQGVARTAADYLSMDEIPNATNVAAVGRLLLAYERADGKNINNAHLISSGEIVAKYLQDRHLATSAKFAAAMHASAKKLAPPSVFGLCHCIMSRIDPAQADIYLHQVCIGESIKKSDPAFAVREGLFRDRVTRVEKIHMIIRGWNAFRQRRKLELAKVVGNLPALV